MTTAPRSKIYTKKGDQGRTQLVDGSFVEKFNPRVEAYGTIDELNSFLGHFITQLSETPFPTPFQETHQKILSELHVVQSQLFNVGSLLACSEAQMIPQLPQLPPQAVGRIEALIDELDAELAPLKTFILPQGHILSTASHILRTVCRRAERRTNEVHSVDSAFQGIQAYLNRLSDFFFVLSRWVNHVHQIPETTWKSGITS